MATSKLEEYVKNAKEKAEQDLIAVRSALRKNNIDAFSDALTTLTESIKEWNVLTEKLEFSKFAASETPLKTAIRTFYITTYRVKETHDKETGKITNMDIVANDKTRIDMEKFVEYAGLDNGWLYDCKELLSLLQLRKMDIYSLKPADITGKSYFFMEAVRKKKDGETPDSNTKIVAALQKIVDATIFEDNGKGLNKHKCTYKDIAFIEDCAHQFDPKAKAGIKSLKYRGFQTVMVSVLYAMLTGENYAVKNFASKKD